MRCHYEVLEIARDATDDDVKKSYRRLALRWHPDKNVGNEEEASNRFKEVSGAFGVLSDPVERRWYDEHRESILKGGDGTVGTADDEEAPLPNLWPYFNTSCFTDNDDFFEVYSGIFLELAALETNAGAKKVPPAFGDMTSSDHDVLTFYAFWCDFYSALVFGWEDLYNLTAAPNRYSRRAAEGENKKARAAAKKKFQETVRALAAFARRIDPRFEIISANAARKKQEAQDRLEAAAQKKIDDRRAAREAGRDDAEEKERKKIDYARCFLLCQEESSSDGSDSDGEMVEYNRGGRGEQSGDLNEMGEEAEESYRCDDCDKDFKTAQQLLQHNASKVHKMKLKEIKRGPKKPLKVSSKKAAAAAASSAASVFTDAEGVAADAVQTANSEESVAGDGTATTATATATATASGEVDLKCRACQYLFATKTELYLHLKATGHDRAEVIDTGKSKKKKKIVIR